MEDTRYKDDIKHQWVEKMCNKFKKPTGGAGGTKDLIIQCQQVQKMIHKKSESSLLGAHSGDDDGSYDDSDNDDQEKRRILLQLRA